MHPCYCVSIIPERPSSSFFIAGLYMTVSAWTVRRCEVNSVKQRRTWCCWRVARSRSELLSLRMAGSTHESIFRASLKLGPRGSIECSSDYAYQQKMSGRWSLPDAVSTKEEVRVQVVSGAGEKRFPAAIGFHRTASQERRKAVSCEGIASGFKIQSSTKTRYFRANQSPTRRKLTCER